MARIKLETTQNVMLEFDLAGTGDRIVSGLLDWLFIAAYIFVCYLLFFIILEVNRWIRSDTGWLFLYIILSTPIAFYHPMFEIFMNGQSPGKKIMKIKVIKLDGSQPGLGDYILRWLFRSIDSLFFYLVAIISVSVSKKEQRLGDIVADTTVVKLKKRATLEDTILKVVEHNYKPVFTDVLRFSDKDINTIKEALELYKKNKNSKHVDLLSKKVKELLNVENTMSSVRLLETVIKDYNYYNHEN